MSDGQLLSPRSRAVAMDSPSTKMAKPKKKMKETIKGVFKTEKKKKDKSKKYATQNVKMLSEYLEKNSLHLEGLMRVSGNQNEVKKLKALLSSGEPVNLDDYADHHVITGAFKMIFREMEEPILTFDLYKNFLGASDLKESNARMSFLKALLITLPPFNAELFNTLLSFLYIIQTNSAVNKMTSENLAIVFAPTVLRPREETVDTMMGDASTTTAVMKFMIDNCKSLFPGAQNLPIISTIVSEEPKAKQEKSMEKLFEESLDKLNAALQSQADEARERAVWESYAQSLELKLKQSDDGLKVMVEERDGLLEAIKASSKSRAALDEQLAKLQEQVESIPKLQEEVAKITGERDKAVEEKYKQLNDLNDLGASNSDSQKKIAALQDELAKLRSGADADKKSLHDQITKTQKEKTDSENKYNQTTKALKADIQKLEQLVAQQGPEIEKLKDQAKHAGTREQELTKQIDGLRGQHKLATKELDVKSQEATKLKKEKQELEDKVARLTKNSQEDKKKLEADSGSKDGKVADLQKQVADLQKQVSDLHHQTDSLTAENSKLLKKSGDAVAVPTPTPSPAAPAQAPTQASSSSKQAHSESEALKRQLEKEKKAHQEVKKLLDAKTDEVERLKKVNKANHVDEAETANKKAPRKNSKPLPATPPEPHPVSTSGLSVEEDLKQHLFTWLTLALKFDRMAMRRICNINASVLYEKIIEGHVHYAEWPSFIRTEMDKCTVDM